MEGLGWLVNVAHAQTPGLTDFGFIKILGRGDIDNLIGNIIGLVLTVAGVVAFVYMIIAGFQYMTAGGDTTKAGTARQHIINAIIGLVIISLSWAILAYVSERLFGGGNTGGTGGGSGGTAGDSGGTGGGSGGGSTQESDRRSPYWTTSNAHNTSAVVIDGSLNQSLELGVGKSFPYMAKLAARPSQNITVQLILQGNLASSLQLTRTALSFNAENWDREQHFAVTYSGEGKSGQRGRVVLKSDQLEYRQFINFLAK